MSVTDPIADFLTRIRNAHMALHETVETPHSRMRESIVKILRDEGFVSGYSVREEGRFKSISIALKYLEENEPAIRHLQRVSKPGRRVYVNKDEIPKVLDGLGVNILSTSQGVMTCKQARREGVGGEILCQVY